MSERFEDRSKADAEILRRTPWTLISAAQKGEAGAFDRAVERIYEMFESAVRNFLRARGVGAEEARDLSQEFFATLLERKFLERLDPAKGRLRHFLFSSLQRFLCDSIDKRDAQKRRPEATLLSLDRLTADFAARPEDPRAAVPGRDFSRAWAAELLGRTVEAMRRRCAGSDRENWYRAVVLWHEVGPDAVALDYSDLARRLGVNPQQAANYLFRGRSLLRSILLEELAVYCSSDAEVLEEIGDLFKALADARSR